MTEHQQQEVVGLRSALVNLQCSLALTDTSQLSLHFSLTSMTLQPVDGAVEQSLEEQLTKQISSLTFSEIRRLLGYDASSASGLQKEASPATASLSVVSSRTDNTSPGYKPTNMMGPEPFFAVSGTFEHNTAARS
jgi:hypothetical protein